MNWMAGMWPVGGRSSSMWTDSQLPPWKPANASQPPTRRGSWIIITTCTNDEGSCPTFSLKSSSAVVLCSTRRCRAQGIKLRLTSPASHCTISSPFLPPSCAKKSLENHNVITCNNRLSLWVKCFGWTVVRELKQPRRQRLQKWHIALNPFRLIGQNKVNFFWSCQGSTCDIRTTKVSLERKTYSPLFRWDMEKLCSFKKYPLPPPSLQVSSLPTCLKFRNAIVVNTCN